MEANNLLLALFLGAGLIGCSRPQTRHVVILPDVSASIDRAALKQAFTAIDDLVSHLERGDKVTIIPILGDAQAEASGRIMRFEVPARRQAYDADLQLFRTKLKSSLDQLESEAMKHPGRKTDILGSIALANQEFEDGPQASKRVLVILSDFIHQDSVLDFETDTRLSNRSTAQLLATQIAHSANIRLKGIPSFLGLLRSNEYSRLPTGRRHAIEQFWTSIFQATGGTPMFAIDGPGLLKHFCSDHV